MKKNAFLIFSLGTLFLLNASSLFAMQQQFLQLHSDANAFASIAAKSQEVMKIMNEINLGKLPDQDEDKSKILQMIEDKICLHNKLKKLQLKEYLEYIRNCLQDQVTAAGIGEFDRMLQTIPSKNDIERTCNSLLLIKAIMSNKTTQIEDLIEKNNADINYHDTALSGWTPMHIAIKYGTDETIQHLLTFKPDLTIKNSRGETAIELSVGNGNQLEKFFLKTAYFVSRTDEVLRKRKEWFFKAISNNNEQEVKRLISIYPEFTETKNNNGVTPLDMATRLDHQKIVLLLERQEASSSTTHQESIDSNKKSSFLGRLFRSMRKPFSFASKKGMGILATLGALRNHFPAKSLINWFSYIFGNNK